MPTWRARPSPSASPFPSASPSVSPSVSPWSWRRVTPLLVSYGGAGGVALGSAALVAQLATPAAGAALLAYTALPGAILLTDLLFLGGGQRVARLMGGEPADSTLVATVAEVAARAGLPPPAHVFEIPTDEMNAFAAGLRRTDQTVAVTRGLRAALTQRELKAVIAHELGHIRSSHVAQNMHTAVAVAGLGGVYQFGRALLREKRGASKRKKKDEEGSPVALGVSLMVVGAAARVAGEFLRCLSSRKNELEADAVAAELYGKEAIISALSKIDRSSGTRGERADSPLKARGGAFAHAYISSPAKRPRAPNGAAPRASMAARGWSRVRGAWTTVQRGLHTHPTLEERVAALRAVGQ